MTNNNIDLTKYNIKENSFRFVQENGRLSDTKLKTKTTTFAKDAFRRFCKNKSSVVGAIILGILILLSLFVPIISPYDVDRVSASEAFLTPKLFEAGTGFWDGTKKYEKTVALDGTINGVLYDFVNETPAGFNKSAVYNCVVDEEPTLINKANEYGSGGYVMFENQQETAEDGTLKEFVYLTNRRSFNITKNGSFKLSVIFGNVDNISGGTLGEYRVRIVSEWQEVVLKDWSTDYSDLDIDIKEKVPGVMSGASIYFDLKPSEEKSTYILIKQCIVETDVVAQKNTLDAISFTDATKMVLLAKDSAGVFPEGYWSSTGRKGVYASEVYYCSFLYDTYENAYGKETSVFGKTYVDKWIQKGWCEYDPTVGPESFKKLSDQCPIDSVIEQIDHPKYETYEITAEAYKYTTLGYDSMPKFILGTDASGVPLFTRMFTGLRTSLLLGVCTAAFCFIFGLIWGSISGYFGGVVDLAMERFCDILGGVPWIVVMTLCILHLSNNFFTFFLALCMTGWMGTAARTRTQFYRFKGSEYVLASRTLGSSDIRLIFKHILPNSLGTIVTSSVLMITSSIYSESTLAYLNLGLQGVQAFGVMLASNQQYIQSNSYLIVFPSIVMALMMISFNLFGNGLRDALNPALRGAED